VPALRPQRGVIISFAGTRDVVEVDACIDETHQFSNTLTDHPVEEGFNITDHSRPDPDVVTLRCFVSNTPLNPEQQTRTIRSGSAQFQTTARAGVRLHAADGRGQSEFAKLLKMRNEGQLVKVATTLKTYESNDRGGMAIQSLNVSRTSKNYDGLEFSVTLKQVRIVKNKSTSDIKSKDTRTGQKKKEGSKVNSETKGKEKSALKSLTESGSSSNVPAAQKAGNFLLRQ
jgi:hypothetical protein